MNMSYCRMHNTKEDLHDCFNAVENRDSLSHDEEEALRSMIQMMFYFLNDNCLIDYENESLDEGQVDLLIKEMTDFEEC